MTQNIPVTYKKQIVGYAIVDPEDYDKANQYTWHCSRNKYAISNNNIRMHHLILGKPEKGYVVDHINGDAFDNRKSNLRFATFQQNAQNKPKRDNTSSKYIGVSKINNKYTVAYANIRLGNFESEEEAAKQYDIYVYLTLGENSRTNNLITYEESQKYKLEDILAKQRNICNNVFYNGCKYYGEIMYNRKIFRTKKYINKEDAENELKTIREEIQKLKDIEKEKHNNQDILYNENGQAIIKTNKGVEVIVDAIYWHKLMEYTWCIDKNGYSYGRCSKRTIKIHQYVYQLHHGHIPELIDHINKNKLDNRIENLGDKTSSHNNHNRTKLKNATSKYYGVSYSKSTKSWQAEITKDGKKYYLGKYKNENDAAMAYNNKAIELYGNNANLNIIT